MYKLKKVGNVNVLPQITTSFSEIDINNLNIIDKMILVDCLNDYSIHAESVILKEEIIEIIMK